MIPCIHCGYCCKTAACSYGGWDEKKQACKFLTDENLCAIYDEVKHDPVSPAMGAGCCSSLNSLRREKEAL